MFPSDRRYSKEHEWVADSGEARRIGITDFAQGELGDIVYVELPDVGRKVQAGDVLGTIESVKAVSEIYAPVSGTVEAVNEALVEKPELVNQEPHEGGWYCSLVLAAPEEFAALMDAAAYGEFSGSAD